MRGSFRSRPFSLLISAPDVTAGMEVRILDSLFQQHEVTLMGAAAAVLTCVFLWPELHWNWLIGWTGAAIGVGVLRHWQGARYFRRADDRHLHRWALGFAASVWAVGALWGGLDFAVFGFAARASAKTYVILASSGVLATGAARNHGSPGAVLGHILLISVPSVFAIYFVSGNGSFHIVALLVVANIVATWSSAVHLQGRLLDILRTDARNLELVDQLNEVNASLLASNAALETTSVTDELTGVMNRRGLMAALDRIWRQGSRMVTPVGAVMIDIDHFKRFNDHCGHIEGDHCLRIVAATLAATLSRPGDICARYGGEEFVVVLPGTDREGCIRVADSLRAAVELRGIAHPGAELGRVSVSLGIATMVPGPERPAIDLLTRADRALYRAKALGRDRWALEESVTRAVAGD